MMEKKEDFKRRMKNKKKEEKQSSLLWRFGFTMFVKALLVIILFLGALIYVKQSDDNKENFKKIVYKNTISFARIYDVYNKYLGDVIPFKNTFDEKTKMVSNETITYNDIKKENNGYILTVTSNYSVPAIKGGIVTAVKKNETYDNLITIQDKNGLSITYGKLNSVDVKLYDYVDKGQLVGESNKELYLIFEKDDKYLSYEEYI